jgi:hypothetical protein
MVKGTTMKKDNTPAEAQKGLWTSPAVTEAKPLEMAQINSGSGADISGSS